ncbi:AraC family transcriptional regulator [Methanococcoides vulcani]|uniref:AraC family transcriptional regulator n=1 Tax=Methanococcoides vulcani TaxID=1353158 RepID=A0A1I0B3F9_9EURY|nr:GyrI-like domain-containing protein [Methanococcoides vulcani]SET01267.1 AraC family transcriptional regulator [Methanococcoides vulcani]
MEIINEPEITEIEERNVAYVSFVGNYLGNTKVFEDLCGKLLSWAGPKQLMGPDTLLMSAYYDDPGVTPPEELKLDMCMTIEDDIEVEGEIKKKKLPGGKYVVMRAELTGAEEYGPAWEKVVEWLIQNNLEIDMSRASYEIYLNSPEEHPEKHHILDIRMPVK